MPGEGVQGTRRDIWVPVHRLYLGREFNCSQGDEGRDIQAREAGGCDLISIEGPSDIAEVAERIGWSRLWDTVLDFGGKAVRGLQNLSRVMSHHGKG